MRNPESLAVHRLDTLTGMRFLAAFVVFGYHGTSILFGNSAQVSEYIFGGGQSGVTFFFVLSGFVLAWASHGQSSHRAFYYRRFARIYPAYFASLLFGAAILLITAPTRLSSAWAPFLMVQAWIPSADYVLAVNIPAWSLSCEAFFYLMFPFVIVWFHKSSDKRLIFLGVGLVATTIAIASAATFLSADSTSGFFPDWIAIFLPLTRFPEFMLGAILAISLRRGLIRRQVPLWPAVILALVSLAWASIDESYFRIAAVPVVPFLLLIAATAQLDLRGKRSILKTNVAQALGRWSYSFYLIHVFCIAAVHTLAEKFGVADLGQGWLVWTSTLIVSIAGSAGLHRFIEQPANNYLIGLDNKRTQKRDGIYLRS